MTNAQILIVEDETIVAWDLRRSLESMGYIVPAIAISGTEAIQQSADIQPDIVLMDIRLQGEMDGIEAATHIHTRFNIPIIYITAYVDDSTLQRAKITEPLGYILKPFNVAEIRPIIELALYKHHTEQQMKEREQSLQRYAGRLEILRDIDQAILAAQSLDAIAYAALSHLQRLITYRRANIVVFDFEAREAVVLAANADETTGDGSVVRLPLELFPTTLAAWQDQGCCVETILSLVQPGSPDYTPHTRDTTMSARISVPLVAQDQLIGALDLASDLPAAFSAEHMEIARDVANQLAVAIQHTWLFEQVRRHAAELEQRVAVRTAELTAANEHLQREIAERQRTETALRDSQRFVQNITDTMPDMVYVYDHIEQRNVYINREVVAALGFTAAEIQAMGTAVLSQLVHPEDLPRVITQIKDFVTAQDGEIREIEYRLRHTNGEWRWFHVRDTVFKRTEEGVPCQVLGVAQDITDRKQTEATLTRAFARLEELNQRLRRSRDVLYTLLDGLDDGLLLLDSAGHILAANQALAALLNRTSTQLERQLWSAVCHSTAPPFPGENALLTLQDGRARRQRERYTSPDGHTYIFDVQTMPLSGPDQTIDQVLLHIVDVTERVRLEALVIENERFAASGKLAATIAHEVNTPLQAIQTFLYLAGEASSEQRNQYLGLASEEIDRIGRIINQLLDLYRPNMRALARVDINALIERVLLLTSGTLSRHGIDVERHLAPALPPLWGVADHLTQVLLNLILNAVAAMPNGGKLCFHTQLHAVPDALMDNQQPAGWRQSLRLEISDSGSGIPQEVQPHIFEPFFTTKPEGSGLGLTVSRRIIVQHGGNISVHSTPGSGTTFTLLFPLDHGDEQERQPW